MLTFLIIMPTPPRFLGVKVQEGEHSSVQDSQAAVRLYTMHRFRPRPAIILFVIFIILINIFINIL